MKLNLPSIKDINDFVPNHIEPVLQELIEQVESFYDNKVFVVITKEKQCYNAYLTFVNRSNFFYKLFQIDCANKDWNLPASIISFSPDALLGAKTKAELESAIEYVMGSDKTNIAIINLYGKN